MKKLIQNSLLILSGIICLILAWMTGTGDILNYINFADPLNEMGFFMALCSMGPMLIFCGLAKS